MNAFNNDRVTVMAVNILVTTPINKVRANPFTIELVKLYSTRQVIIVEILESRIDGQARLKLSNKARLFSNQFFSLPDNVQRLKYLHQPPYQ